MDLAVGTGPQVKQGDHVAVKYVGKLIDGTVFDASAKHPEMGPTFNYVQGVTGADRGLDRRHVDDGKSAASAS